MKTVDYRESWKRARAFAEEYNRSCITGQSPSGTLRYDLRQKLRPAHLDLLRLLIRLYSLQLASYKYMVWDQTPPPLQTNSQALARLLDCSPRTVRHLLARLIRSGAILEKQTRGRRHDYRLTFSPKVIHLSKGLFPDREILRIEAKERTLENQLLNSEICRSFPQLDTIPNKKNKRRCGKPQGATPADQQQPTVPLLSGNSHLQKGDAGGNHNHERPPCHKETHLQKHAPGEDLDHRSKPGHADALNWSRLDDYHTRLYSLILATLYRRLPFLAASQSFHIKRFLAHEFAGKPEEEYENHYQQLRLRVLVAEDWLRRDPSRYIPIPQVYFDPDNPRGFSRTAEWLADGREATARAAAFKRRYSSLMQAWGAFLQTIDRSLSQSGTSGYAQGRREVAARYAPLVRAYDYVIMQTLHNNQIQ